MNKTVNKKIEDALLDFYLEADKNIIEEIIQEDILAIIKDKNLIDIIEQIEKHEAE